MVMRRIVQLAQACDPEDDWCATATDAVGDYLGRNGIGATQYYPSDERFGGFAADATHAYLVLDDGTIVDPTITQFVERGSPRQRARVAGYPTLPGFPSVAVVPPGHPFVQQAEYESHRYGLGYTCRPAWVPYDFRVEAVRSKLGDSDVRDVPGWMLPDYR